MNHNNNFYFLRLVGALLVIITHAWLITGQDAAEPLRLLSGNTIAISTIGLYIFFFTSGFLVTGSARESENTGHFLFKRVLRIYPALIVVVLISVFIAGPLLTRLSVTDYYHHKHTWSYLGNATGFNIKYFLPGVFDNPPFHIESFNGSLWTIALELKLYISLAILVALGWIQNKKLHLFICSGMILTAYLLWMLRHYNYVPIKLIGQKDLQLGIVFYLGSMIQTGKPSARLLIITGVLAGFAFILRLSGKLGFILLDEILFFSIATYFIAFTNKFRVRIGNDISYGIYIFSMPLQQCCYMFSGYNTDPWLNLLLVLVPSAIVAWLSWQCIEKPSLQLKPYYNRFTAALNPWH